MVTLINILRRQLEKSIAMLHDIIKQCPDDIWVVDDGIAPIWQQAYHSIFSLNAWVRDLSQPFDGPSFHNSEAQAMVKDAAPIITREQMAGYLQLVQGECNRFLDSLTPELLSEEEEVRGRKWTPADRIIGQIRHVQHHIGAMHSALRRHGNLSLRWIGLIDVPGDDHI
jgi:uncharacterized damage-inducible protein DinB